MTRHETTQTAPTALSPRQIELVRESFAAVIPIRQTAATLFYARLFELAPEVRPLFPRDLDAQGAKLMAALAARFTDEVRAAWTAAYGLLSGIMLASVSGIDPAV